MISSTPTADFTQPLEGFEMDSECGTTLGRGKKAEVDSLWEGQEVEIPGKGTARFPVRPDEVPYPVQIFPPLHRLSLHSGLLP